MTWDDMVKRVEKLIASLSASGAAHMRDGQSLARRDASLGAVQHAAHVGATDALNAEALRLLLAHAVPREDRERALEAMSEAAGGGASLSYEIEEHKSEPWRWNYPRVYLSDNAVEYGAREAVHHAREARRLLKLDTEDRDAKD